MYVTATALSHAVLCYGPLCERMCDKTHEKIVYIEGCINNYNGKILTKIYRIEIAFKFYPRISIKNKSFYNPFHQFLMSRVPLKNKQINKHVQCSYSIQIKNNVKLFIFKLKAIEIPKTIRFMFCTSFSA